MAYTSWQDPQYAAALELHHDIGLFDLHVDSLIVQRLFGYDPSRAHRAGRPGQPLFWHADFPRMRQAGYGAACMGIHYFPWESEAGWRECLRQLDVLDRLCSLDGCAAARSPSDWEERGALRLAAGVEGAHMLNGDLGRVQELVRRGVAYLTLAHFSKNRACTPSMGRGANERDGLSTWGEELVSALQKGGITVDVAHVNHPGVMDVCALSQRPLFCTHTCARGLYHHPRGITDEAMKAVADTGGAVGVMFNMSFLGGGRRQSSAVLADQIDYMRSRIGVEHLVLGSDFDGWISPIPSDFRDCRDLVKLSVALMRRGFSEDDLRLLYRQNALRVFRANQVSAGSSERLDQDHR